MDLIEQLEERAAIHEHEGGLDLIEADHLAARWLTMMLMTRDGVERRVAEAVTMLLLSFRKTYLAWDARRERNSGQTSR